MKNLLKTILLIALTQLIISYTVKHNKHQIKHKLKKSQIKHKQFTNAVSDSFIQSHIPTENELDLDAEKRKDRSIKDSQKLQEDIDNLGNSEIDEYANENKNRDNAQLKQYSLTDSLKVPKGYRD